MDNRLIVALDVSTFEKAEKLVDELAGHVNIFKVGPELFTGCGPKIIEHINEKKKKVFLDFKFLDISNTVKKATLQAAQHKVFMLTLHTTGGLHMLREAVGAVKDIKNRPLLVGVTVLTSDETENTTEEVLKLAKVAHKAGLDGIVCSAKETKHVKEVFGDELLIVNPGIRPEWAAQNDQKRIAIPEEAIANGADFIVVGRPIIEAKNPAKAAEKILKELHNV
ncbi:MAG: orotidine-5'-phosphate decarboxylase [Omnitrophica bacterium]|nr:orotidine-5'-phosphate decarboxylase [Candidatus Omnitrophota bacterium]